MDSIFFEALLKDTVVLLPRQLNKGYIEEIRKILKIKVEDKCFPYGYVKKDTVEVVKRPIGSVQRGYMNGNVVFDVTFKAMICNPAYGNVIDMKVTDIKKEVGLWMEDDFLTVVVPTDIDDDRSGFENIKEGDTVKVFVLDKTIDTDNTITVVAKIYNEKTDKEQTVNLGEIEKSDAMQKEAFGDESDSDSSDESDSDSGSESDESEFPDDAEDINSDGEGDSDDDKANSEEEEEVEDDDNGETAIEGDEEQDDEELADKKGELEADMMGDPAESEEESDEDGQEDEFDYAG